MIKLKDILLENTAPDIFIPRRTEDRIERLIKQYIRNGSKGDLKINSMNLIELPDILKNVTVNGDFVCEMNQLTSLKNSPKYVSGDFNCSINKLTSLAGAPTNVGGDFWCDDNSLISLQGAPSSVGGSFYCSYNNLTSLEGAPKTVGNEFSCGVNARKFTESQVRAVCDVKGRIFGVLYF